MNNPPARAEGHTAAWLPTANCCILSGYDMEMYFDPMDGRRYEEARYRVQPKQAGTLPRTAGSGRTVDTVRPLLDSSYI